MKQYRVDVFIWIEAEDELDAEFQVDGSIRNLGCQNSIGDIIEVAEPWQ